MSRHTLRDLRDTLDSRAATVHDESAPERIAAVAGRARAVRRNRALGAVAAAVVVVAAVTAVSLLPGGGEPRPADRVVLGEEAPATMTSLGWTYRFVDSAEAPDGSRVTMSFSPSDDPRLVSWTTDGRQDVVVSLGDGDERRFDDQRDVEDFGDFVWLPPGYSGEVSVTGSGQGVGMASYEVDETQLPDGLGEGLMTFRDEVADAELLDATVGEPGQAEVLLDLEVPDGPVRLHHACRDVPPGLGVAVAIEGRNEPLLVESRCEGRAFDPAGDGGFFPRFRVHGALGKPGETVTMRMWLTDAPEGSGSDEMAVATDVGGARMGLGAYAIDPPARLLDLQVAFEREYDGHLWSLFQVVRESDQADIGFEHGGAEPLLAVGQIGRAKGADLELVGDQFGRPAVATLVPTRTLGVLDPVGDDEVEEARLRLVRGDPRSELWLAVLVYERAD